MKLEDVRLGESYADTVTRMEGVCTAKVEYLQDENRVLLESVDKVGRPVEFWAPVRRLTAKEE